VFILLGRINSSNNAEGVGRGRTTFKAEAKVMFLTTSSCNSLSACYNITVAQYCEKQKKRGKQGWEMILMLAEV
jgi:hypothetical protein